MNASAPTAQRDGYHHGDLRNALVDAAVELARAGGPEAIVLREAARRVGVSPTASYRHFASHRELFAAVKARAEDVMAVDILQAIEQCDDALEAAGDTDPRHKAVARLRATGHAYLDFAFAEPGLYNTAFCRERTAPLDAPPEPGYTTASAFVLLGKLLDDLVDSGAMPAAVRPLAEFGSWAAVHGFASLVIDGPLRVLGGPQRAEAVEAVLDGVERSLSLCGR